MEIRARKVAVVDEIHLLFFCLENDLNEICSIIGFKVS